MAKQSFGGIVQSGWVTTLPFGGDVTRVHICFKTIHHLLKWEIAAPGQAGFPSISAFPCVTHVLEVCVDCLGSDQFPCFRNRLP